MFHGARYFWPLCCESHFPWWPFSVMKRGLFTWKPSFRIIRRTWPLRTLRPRSSRPLPATGHQQVQVRTHLSESDHVLLLPTASVSSFLSIYSLKHTIKPLHWQIATIIGSLPSSDQTGEAVKHMFSSKKSHFSDIEVTTLDLVVIYWVVIMLLKEHGSTLSHGVKETHPYTGHLDLNATFYDSKHKINMACDPYSFWGGKQGCVMTFIMLRTHCITALWIMALLVMFMLV